jgi:hypothetical protein
MRYAGPIRELSYTRCVRSWNKNARGGGELENSSQNKVGTNYPPREEREERVLSESSEATAMTEASID